MEIASNYHWIVAFCKKVQQTKTTDFGQVNEGSIQLTPHGLYIKAFGNGVLDVLGDYRNEIVRLEESFLQNPQLPLTFIFSCLEKYQVLFNMLKSVIDVLQKENLHGCLLMGRLHKYIYCGVDCIVNAAEKYGSFNVLL